MEVKLSQKIHLSFPHCKTSLKNHFKGLAESWRFHLLETSKIKGHFIKGGETLKTISRHYGASFHSIVAANKNVSDVKFLCKGQLPNIPAFVPAVSQLYQIKKTGNSSLYQKERLQSSMAILDSFLNQKPFVMLSAHGLHHAKSTGYLLVLVPLIAFCITCICGAFRSRVPSDMRHRAVDESRKNGHARWKNALNDIKEPDNLDSESRMDFKNASEDQDKNLNEDMSNAYRILEQDYQKFLSECGITKSGYWRRGLHK